MVATLALGEHGGTDSALGRWAFVVLVLGAGGRRPAGSSAGAGARSTRAGATRSGCCSRRSCSRRSATRSWRSFGVDVFTQRYITILVPVAAALGAVGAVDCSGPRVAALAAAVLLVLSGAGNFARRLGGQWQPDLTPVAPGGGGGAPAHRC